MITLSVALKGLFKIFTDDEGDGSDRGVAAGSGPAARLLCSVCVKSSIAHR